MYLLEQVLWLGALGLAAALVFKLVIVGLSGTYTWFVVFLCFEIARGLVLLPIRPNTTTYAWIFLITQPLMWLLYILVVLELYSLALRGRRGIATLSQWTLSFSLAVAVGISALTLWADLSRPVGRYPILVYYSVIERGLIFSLVLFLLLITVFLSWFPIAVSRNIRLHAAVYSVYFISTTLALFLRNVAGYSASPWLSVTLLLVDVVCFTLWLGGLNRRGEEQLVTGGRWRPEDEERLLRQMDTLNAAVLRHPEE